MSHGMSKFNAVSDTNDVKHGVKIAEDLRDWYLHLKGIGDHPSDRQRIPSVAEIIERTSCAESELSAALERVKLLEETQANHNWWIAKAKKLEAERDAALARIRELERLGRDSVAATDCQGECDDSIPETCPHRALKAALESTPEAK